MARDISNSLQKWSDTNQDVLKLSKHNNGFESILQRNIKIHQQLKLSDNMNEFFSEACKNMNNLLIASFNDFVSVRCVVLIVVDIMPISLEFSFVNYFQLAKISMQLLKLNRDLIDASDKNDILEPIISTICKDFLWTFDSLHRNFTELYHKIAKFQLNLIDGIWKLYPGSFNGAAHLVKTIVNLECLSSKENLDILLSDLKVQLKNHLHHNRHAPQIYIDFFTQFDGQSENELFHLYKLCFEILAASTGDEVLLNIVFLSEDNSNFCLKFIQVLTENPLMIHSNPELCYETIMIISQLLYTEGLEEKNLRHFEFALVGLMIHGKYSTGLFCMHIWLDFLAQIRSKEGLMQYFIFFQTVLKQIWNPATEITTKFQIFISSILQFIVESHPKIAQTKIADIELIFPFTQCNELSSAMIPFNEVLPSSFVASPSAEKYYELIKSLKFLSTGGINDITKDSGFCDLLAIDTNFEWSIYSELIINIIEVIIATKDHQRKMFFLLKFKPFLDCEQSKPFSVQLKLVDLMFSYLPLVESKIGLPELITRELYKLLMSAHADSIITDAIVKRLYSEPKAAKLLKNINFDEKDTKENRLNVIIRSNMFDEPHKCIQKKVARVSSEQSTITNHSRQLNIILKYSQWIQKQQLQDSDINTLHLISDNFKKIAKS